MQTASKKSKARKLQQTVREELLKLFPDLHEDDIKSTPMGVAGEDVQLSPAARAKLPFQFECKNIASFAGYKYMEQAKTHGPYTPIAVIKANYKQPIIMMTLEDFMELINETKST